MRRAVPSPRGWSPAKRRRGALILAPWDGADDGNRAVPSAASLAPFSRARHWAASPHRPAPTEAAFAVWDSHAAGVSKHLGDATVSITLDTCLRAIPALQEEAAERIAGLAFAG